MAWRSWTTGSQKIVVTRSRPTWHQNVKVTRNFNLCLQTSTTVTSTRVRAFDERCSARTDLGSHESGHQSPGLRHKSCAGHVDLHFVHQELPFQGPPIETRKFGAVTAGKMSYQEDDALLLFGLTKPNVQNTCDFTWRHESVALSSFTTRPLEHIKRAPSTRRVQYL